MNPTPGQPTPRLAIDLGTSHTVAVVRRDGQAVRALLFDGSPLLPSGVYLGPDGVAHTGRDAVRLSQVDPAGYEPHPKRGVDDEMVLLGVHEVPPAMLLTAVLRRVAAAAAEAGVHPGEPVVLTCPADWGRRRRGVLLDAAYQAGLHVSALVDEPVAAATYCMHVLQQQVPVGHCLVVFDFGGGTLDVAAIRREPTGLRVLGTSGLDNLGGLDIDAALFGHFGHLVTNLDEALWRRLAAPTDAASLRDRQAFLAEVRAAKEMLSRTASAPVALPGAANALHLTREELERVAGPLVDRAVDEARRLLRSSGIGHADFAGLFLVGGSSRMPLVSSRLHTRLGVAPTVPEQPELPVAYGALWHQAPPPGSGAGGAGGAWGADSQDWPATTDSLVPVPPPITATRRPNRLLTAVAGAVALLVLAVAGIWQFTDIGRPEPAGNETTNEPTTNAANAPAATPTGGRPAAPAGFVVCGETGQFCPTAPICWGGQVVSAGRETASRVDCTREHYFETFALGVLPADAVDIRQEDFVAQPAFTGLCTEALLRARAKAPASVAGWGADALRVDIGGSRYFHCIAGPEEGGETTGSVFRVGA